MSNTEKLHYDYGFEFEEGEESSWLWIAKMENPGLPEPHCYSLVFSAEGTHAAALIKNFHYPSSSQTILSNTAYFKQLHSQSHR